MQNTQIKPKMKAAVAGSFRGITLLFLNIYKKTHKTFINDIKHSITL